VKGDRRRPDEAVRRRRPARTLALALAVLVHLVFIGVLVWSVRWQSRPPEVVSAELYAPPPKVRAPEPEPPKPEPPPKVEPPPPAPEPKVEPKIAPPPPKVAQPDPEIALKARREEEKRQRERAEAEKREREKQVAAEKRATEEKRKADEKRAAEARERLEKETTAMREAAEREAKDRERMQAQAKAEADARAKTQAEANARSAAQADWVRRIQAKIRGNVVLPPDLAGNPEAVFEVIQLPTGEILDVQLRKSSGARAYDEAVQRAILKSSPLPRPERAELFQRSLTLRFRPLD